MTCTLQSYVACKRRLTFLYQKFWHWVLQYMIMYINMLCMHIFMIKTSNNPVMFNVTQILIWFQKKRQLSFPIESSHPIQATPPRCIVVATHLPVSPSILPAAQRAATLWDQHYQHLHLQWKLRTDTQQHFEPSYM